MAVIDRFKRAFNAFIKVGMPDPIVDAPVSYSGGYYGVPPQRLRMPIYNERSIIAGVYTRIAMDVANLMSYRTEVGNDINQRAGYKIHVLYNLTAVQNPKTSATLTLDPEAVEFEWTITSIPEVVSGYRASSHDPFGVGVAYLGQGCWQIGRASCRERV